MASWIIHLRVADALISRFKNICETEFVVGNLAPDSGVPNADWSDFSPSPVISHFKLPDETGHMRANIGKYIECHFTAEKQMNYTPRQYSFYLGYLCHLLTDLLWVKSVFPICAAKSPEAYATDPKGIVWTWKKDFFDIDTLFLRNNPEFRSFAIYENAIGFKNEYLDIFSSDAFEQKRAYITSFYNVERNDFDREYFYFTEKEACEFVLLATDEIEKRIMEYSQHQIANNEEV